jgi:hypothetical protein
VATEDDLLERTLAFSGSYISDDGNLVIRRYEAAVFEYSSDRFLGQCAVCARAGRVAASGEVLSDIGAATTFAAVHHHGDVD